MARKKVGNLDFDVFLEGETIDLCVPTEEIAYASDWYNFFNKKRITKYLEQGLFPNTREDQKKFFQEETNANKRLILLIVTKENPKLKGVVSLSGIDFFHRCANLALVVDEYIEPRASRLAALEAVALISVHGFETLRLEKICAKQNRNLETWQQRMELLGYRVEGIHKNEFFAAQKMATNSVSIACCCDDYQIIIDNRGQLFDDESSMLKRIKNLPKTSVASKMEELSENIYNDHYLPIWR